MRLALFTSLMLAIVLAATGCSVSGKATRTTPTVPAANIADTSSDPSWTPPGEMDFAIDDSKGASRAQAVTAESVPRPNRREIPRGQVHAAVY